MDIVQKVPLGMDAYDYEDIIIDSTAGGKGFTLSKLNNDAAGLSNGVGHARMVIAQLNSGDARYTMHAGGVPVDGGPGMLATDGTILTFVNYNIMQNFRMIQDGANPSVLRVTYFTYTRFIA